MEQSLQCNCHRNDKTTGLFYRFAPNVAFDTALPRNTTPHKCGIDSSRKLLRPLVRERSRNFGTVRFGATMGTLFHGFHIRGLCTLENKSDGPQTCVGALE